MSGARVIVVGAGPAGLAAAWAARQAGAEPVVLEASERVGGAWARIRPEMRCLSPRRHDRMPDGHIPDGDDRATAADVHRALLDFHHRAGLDVRFNTPATALTAGQPLEVATSSGPLTASCVVVATGEYGRPRWPVLPGVFDGPIVHSSEFCGDDVRPGERTLVVGAGNSGAETAVLVAGLGARVTLASSGPVRRPAREKTGWLGELTYRLSALPIRHLPYRGGCMGQTPVVDPHLFDAVASGAVRVVPRVQRLVGKGVVTTDGHERPADRIVLCTGFRRDTAWLKGAIALGPDGEPSEHNGLSTELPGLGFVGIPCMRTRRSGFLRGFVDDATYVVRHLLKRTS